MEQSRRPLVRKRGTMTGFAYVPIILPTMNENYLREW